MTNADSDVETLKAELESAQTALVTQQKVFYQILAGTDSSALNEQLSTLSMGANKNKNSSKGDSSSINDSKKIKTKGDMFL